MRRLIAIPIKTSVVTALLMAGAVYVAAEARQAVLRRQQQELAKIETTPANSQPASTGVSSATPLTPASPQQTPAATVTNDEVAAEQQASQLPAQKPASEQDSHARQIVISIADRRLALVEDGQIVKIYPIAVGARSTPALKASSASSTTPKTPRTGTTARKSLRARTILWAAAGWD